MADEKTTPMPAKRQWAAEGWKAVGDSTPRGIPLRVTDSESEAIARLFDRDEGGRVWFRCDGRSFFIGTIKFTPRYWRALHSSDPLLAIEREPPTKKQLSHRSGKKREKTPRRVRTVGRGAAYYAYLKSDAWAAVKRRYMESRMIKKCSACLKPWQPGYHLHHKTYERLGNELLTDLVMLCPACHADLHSKVKIDKKMGKRTNKYVSRKRKALCQEAARLRVKVKDLPWRS
jgi:5-methylcytosine-specific restriction endonuclease McrA